MLVAGARPKYFLAERRIKEQGGSPAVFVPERFGDGIGSNLKELFRPAPQFRIPSGDTIVCRCEEVSARDILDAVAIGATGPNQLKAYRRTGMGPCQGRLCGLTVTELMAKARGKSPQEIGYYRLRAPVKPITLAELAAVPKTEDDVKAVVRG